MIRGSPGWACMIASDLATLLRRIGVEVDLAALGDLPPRELDLELCARALEHPHAFTDAELLELRSDHDITALDLGRIVFCPNVGAFGAGPPRSYHGRAPRRAWAPQVSTWITFYCDHDASRDSVFDAWTRRYMPDAAAVKLRDDAIARMRAEAVSRELAHGRALLDAYAEVDPNDIPHAPGPGFITSNPGELPVFHSTEPVNDVVGSCERVAVALKQGGLTPADRAGIEHLRRVHEARRVLEAAGWLEDGNEHVAGQWRPADNDAWVIDVRAEGMAVVLPALAVLAVEGQR
jgi:hypothetical protein